MYNPKIIKSFLDKLSIYYISTHLHKVNDKVSKGGGLNVAEEQWAVVVAPRHSE
jgi:hypothetical protein